MVQRYPMSKTAGISKGAFVVGLIVAISVTAILSVGIAYPLFDNGPKGDTSKPASPEAFGASMNAAEIENQIQVSGTIHAIQNGTIVFFDGHDLFSSDITVSSPIINGQFSVLLVGGKSYNVVTDNAWYYLLYVPLDAKNFTVNF